MVVVIKIVYLKSKYIKSVIQLIIHLLQFGLIWIIFKILIIKVNNLNKILVILIITIKKKYI